MGCTFSEEDNGTNTSVHSNTQRVNVKGERVTRGGVMGSCAWPLHQTARPGQVASSQEQNGPRTPASEKQEEKGTKHRRKRESEGVEEEAKMEGIRVAGAEWTKGVVKLVPFTLGTRTGAEQLEVEEGGCGGQLLREVVRWSDCS